MCVSVTIRKLPHALLVQNEVNDEVEAHSEDVVPFFRIRPGVLVLVHLQQSETRAAAAAAADVVIVQTVALRR